MAKKHKYNIIMSEETLKKIHDYHHQLHSGKGKPGAHLDEKLSKAKKPIKKLNIEEFIGLLLSTKKPKISPERELQGNGKDWNNHELSILGDINLQIPDVTIYDNGVHEVESTHFKIHPKSFLGDLLFTPGALLKTWSQFEGPIPDLAEIAEDNQIHQPAYNKLVKRRILPVLAKINDQAKQDKKPALVTMPGIGAGEFSGHNYSGKMGEHLNKAMHSLLEKYAPKLGNIDVIHYDPYNECSNQQKNFGKLKYRVRPKLSGNAHTPQLSHPAKFQEDKDKFSRHKLYKIVSADHISMPGHDFFGGIRSTDNGIAAAATNVMKIITGITGKYDKNKGQYNPPKRYKNWEEAAGNKCLHCKGNIHIVDDNAEIYPLRKLMKQKEQLTTTKKKTTHTKAASNKKLINKMKAVQPIRKTAKKTIKTTNKKNISALLRKKYG